MIFDRLSSPAAIALLAGLAALIVLLYWLRPPAPSVAVPSTLTWRRLAERSRRTRRWRRLLSLLLSLVAASAMAAALAGLRVAPPGADGPPLVVVIDTSATMAAETSAGESRLQRAVAEARLEIARSAGPVDLYDTTGQLVRTRLTVADALRLIGDLQVHPARRPRFPPAALAGAATADATAGAAGGVRRLLFSDGVAPLGATPGFERLSVFEPAVNVGVIAFEAARSGSLVEAFVEVLNGSLRPVVAELLLDTAAGEVLVRRPLRLAPAERWSGVIDLAPLAAVVAASPVLRARVLADGDALALDDVAFAPVPLGAPLRLAVAGPEGTATRRVLELLAGFSVQAITVDQVSELRAGSFDLLLLEETAPSRRPPLPTLWIDPPARPWLPVPRAEIGPSSWSRIEPHDDVTAALEGLRVESIQQHDPADARVLARPATAAASRAQPVPLLLHHAGDPQTPPWTLLPFAVEGSSLPDREGFPPLLETLLLELAGVRDPRPVEAGVVEVGDLELAGSEPRFDLASGRYAELETPALLGPPDRTARAVAPLGPLASALNHTDWPAAAGERHAAGEIVAAGAGLPWRELLLGLALTVAAVELWTRRRGITE